MIRSPSVCYLFKVHGVTPLPISLKNRVPLPPEMLAVRNDLAKPFFRLTLAFYPAKSLTMHRKTTLPILAKVLQNMRSTEACRDLLQRMMSVATSRKQQFRTAARILKRLSNVMYLPTHG